MLVRFDQRNLLLDANLLAKLLDHFADFADGLMRRSNRIGNYVLRQLFCADLDHVHRFFATAQKQAQVTVG
jgi:hypothetical protein